MSVKGKKKGGRYGTLPPCGLLLTTQYGLDKSEQAAPQAAGCGYSHTLLAVLDYPVPIEEEHLTDVVLPGEYLVPVGGHCPRSPSCLLCHYMEALVEVVGKYPNLVEEHGILLPCPTCGLSFTLHNDVI